MFGPFAGGRWVVLYASIAAQLSRARAAACDNAAHVVIPPLNHSNTFPVPMLWLKSDTQSTVHIRSGWGGQPPTLRIKTQQPMLWIAVCNFEFLSRRMAFQPKTDWVSAEVFTCFHGFQPWSWWPDLNLLRLCRFSLQANDPDHPVTPRSNRHKWCLLMSGTICWPWTLAISGSSEKLMKHPSKIEVSFNMFQHVWTFQLQLCSYIVYLAGGFKHFLISIIFGIILPIDELIFFKMVKTTNQICSMCDPDLHSWCMLPPANFLHGSPWQAGPHLEEAGPPGLLQPGKPGGGLGQLRQRKSDRGTWLANHGKLLKLVVPWIKVKWLWKPLNHPH